MIFTSNEREHGDETTATIIFYFFGPPIAFLSAILVMSNGQLPVFNAYFNPTSDVKLNLSMRKIYIIYLT